jgi:hypothetical protein
MSLAAFDHTLGSPVFIRGSTRGGYFESTFRGDGYWVQTVSDRDGMVVENATTSCDSHFSPTISLAGVGYRVTLQHSKFSNVEPGESGSPDDYFVSTTGSQNAHMYDEDLGGNGSYYKQLAWGFTDACPKGVVELDRYISTGVLKTAGNGGVLDTEAPWIDRFRKSAIVNTYAETAPNVSFYELKHLVFGHGYSREDFQIGVDQYLTRLTEQK